MSTIVDGGLELVLVKAAPEVGGTSDGQKAALSRVLRHARPRATLRKPAPLLRIPHVQTELLERRDRRHDDLDLVGAAAGVVRDQHERRLAPSGDDEPDLRVYEVGPAVERTVIGLRLTTPAALMWGAALGGDSEGWVDAGVIAGSALDVDVDERLGPLDLDGSTPLPYNCRTSESCLHPLLATSA